MATLVFSSSPNIMQAHELADLAALAAVHGHHLAAADVEISNRSLAAYWKASRCRIDRWCRKLRSLADRADHRPWSTDELGIVEEILVSEILARVVAGIAVAQDAHHATNESAPVGRNIFTAHLDVRRRALALIVAPHRDPEQAEEVLALRRQCDRWTDLLLAYFTPLAAVDEFAASPARVRDFAYDAREHLRSGASAHAAVAMIHSGMRTSLARYPNAVTANSDLNREIAAAVLAAFSPEFFDSHGYLRSAWLEKIRALPMDAPLQAEPRWLTPHASHEVPRPARWRR